MIHFTPRPDPKSNRESPPDNQISLKLDNLIAQQAQYLLLELARLDRLARGRKGGRE